MKGSSAWKAASASHQEESSESSPDRNTNTILALPKPNAPKPNYFNSRKRNRDTNVSGTPTSVEMTPAKCSRIGNRRAIPSRVVRDVLPNQSPSTGENNQRVKDIFSKILAFCQLRTSAVYIISGSGSVSNVTFNNPELCGETFTYEGIFDILTLSGSFFLSETGGCRTRTGSLTLSLAGPDGRLMGGLIAGTLIAATPVQVMVWLKWK